MPAALVANVCVILVFAVGAALFGIDPDAYYLNAQEDEPLEWATFWAFLLAAGFNAHNALADRRRRGGIPWFHVGLAAFCLLVALEEISWGQRVLGYRAPEFFLERNYQQEFNLHNIVDGGLRRTLMLLILAGYGVLAPLASAPRTVRAWADRLRIVTPPPALVPTFATAAVIYAWYPADLTGGWVECAMGLAFLYAALLDRASPARLTAGRAAAAALAVAGLGIVTTGALDGIGTRDADRLAAARREIAALASDFSGPRLHTRCGIHKRLYTFMVEYGQPYLRAGEFARLAASTGAEERATYLLDPWNSPYWIRHKCEGGRVSLFVYSFGPNRQRDSSEWELGGDDIGANLQPRR